MIGITVFFERLQLLLFGFTCSALSHATRSFVQAASGPIVQAMPSDLTLEPVILYEFFPQRDCTKLD